MTERTRLQEMVKIIRDERKAKMNDWISRNLSSVPKNNKKRALDLINAYWEAVEVESRTILQEAGQAYEEDVIVEYEKAVKRK